MIFISASLLVVDRPGIALSRRGVQRVVPPMHTL
jgi:hypothetical protein